MATVLIVLFLVCMTIIALAIYNGSKDSPTACETCEHIDNWTTEGECVGCYNTTTKPNWRMRSWQ